jgi:hypothetical protein
MDSSNAFASFIGNLVGSKNNQQVPQQQYQQQVPQQYQQQYQQQVPQQYQQQIVLENYKRDAITETTDDGMPSKMKDPDNIQDDIDLNNILRTMRERKKEKERQEVTETTDDILKSIPMAAQKRGRGRPKKLNNSIRMM